MKGSVMSWFRNAGRWAALSVTAALVAGGCQNDQQARTSPVLQEPVDSGQAVRRDRRPAQPVSEPAPVRETVREQPRSSGGCAGYSPNVSGMNVAHQYFPTGDAGSSALLIHTVMPTTVNRGMAYDVEIHATNVTRGTLQNVVVDLKSTSNMSPVSSEPTASRANDGGVRWELGDLGSCETRIIRVRATSDAIGLAGNCLAASYNNELCATTQVVEAALTLRKQATREALLCDTITLQYEVCNPGTGVASGVRVTDTLPAGLTTVDGASSVNVDVGNLAPGECKTITVQAKASRTGTFESPASAVASNDLRADAAATTTIVSQPALEIVSECNDVQFVGRNITYQFRVTNTGDASCENTIVTASLPSNATFVRASDGGSGAGSQATWNLGSLAPGADRLVSVTVQPNAIGSYRATARAECVCASPVAAECVTEVRGIPAVLLEVIDIDDPVEVGSTTTYEITVTNQGSAQDSNIRIVCELPPELEFVSAGGATNGSARGQTVTFAPLPTLAPKAKATWTVVVRATGEGNIRFTTNMLTDQLGDNPVRETESTNLYR